MHSGYGGQMQLDGMKRREFIPPLSGAGGLVARGPRAVARWVGDRVSRPRCSRWLCGSTVTQIAAYWRLQERDVHGRFGPLEDTNEAGVKASMWGAVHAFQRSFSHPEKGRRRYAEQRACSARSSGRHSRRNLPGIGAQPHSRVPRNKGAGAPRTRVAALHGIDQLDPSR